MIASNILMDIYFDQFTSLNKHKTSHHHRLFQGYLDKLCIESDQQNGRKLGLDVILMRIWYIFSFISDYAIVFWANITVFTGSEIGSETFRKP